MTKENYSKPSKIDSTEAFFPAVADSSRLVIGCGYDQYAASQVARAVEDADARLLNLNVTRLDPAERRMVIDLRIDHRNPEAVARSLERYGYTLLDIDSDDLLDDDNETRARYNLLMRLISM